MREAKPEVKQLKDTEMTTNTTSHVEQEKRLDYSSYTEQRYHDDDFKKPFTMDTFNKNIEENSAYTKIGAGINHKLKEKQDFIEKL
jgi:hypothetical protein